VTDYAIFMLDPTGRVATWNEGAKRMKGYEAQEIIGQTFSSFFGEEAIRKGLPEEELNQARVKGRFEDEGWRYRKDGSAFWANVVLTAIRNQKNEVVGFSKITRDLTEKRRLEQQLFQMNEDLRESEEKSRLLIDSVKDYAILMLNPNGVVISWNSGAELIKGYTAKEIIGRHFSAFYTREAIESGFPQYELDKAVELGRFEDEGWRLRKDGTAFWANVVISPVYNTDNRLLGFAKVTRDLTERRRNEELMLKNQELVRINNDLDDFVYAASHDLKAPITNMEGLLVALGDDLGPEKERHGKILVMMENAVTGLKKVVSDLSEVIKLKQEKEKPETVDIPVLLAEVKESLGELIHASKAEIEVDISGFKELEFSRKNLRSVLFNLVSNAIKYADPQRTAKVSIKTYMSPTNDRVLSVADNGLGIPENQVGKIFIMFKRLHDHVEGSGIGLYLVKRIVDNSGGRILVESQVGKGSVFRVFFRQEDPRP
jgi:PAS domain S-box-containing protein